ncbi:MAG: aldo/keto reductase [Sphaerochaetaceae bacterium]|nr:aldo/keto reductase [Sphaerochaetaceae bacterium]
MDIPFYKTYDGDRIPAIGFGTFGSDHVDPASVAASVRTAIRLGYRQIDCAAVYGNEKEIGTVLHEAMTGKIPDTPAIERKDLWITSKLWNDKHAPQVCTQAFFQSLGDLGLDYVDLYLVHWPFPNFHPSHCDVTSRSADARPYIHEEFMALWHELEILVDKGYIRHLGTSNMTIPKLEMVLRDCRIKPAFNEMELHPSFQQPALLSYVRNAGIIPIGFCPLGSPNRPDRDKMPDDIVDMEMPSVMALAAKHKCHPAAICLKWARANGIIPIPFSTKERNILSNLEAVCQDPLTEAEAASIPDCNSRLVKGQVFLWKDAGDDWTKLWDPNGTIEH